MNRRSLIVIFSAVFLISLGGLLNNLLAYRQGERMYQEAANLVKLPDLSGIAPETSKPDLSQPEQPYIDPYADALAAMDFNALQEVNPEVWGWILIPNTAVSYPLLQHANNSYYLSHSWSKASSPVGAIFLECQCSKSLSDFNTIIYGHRMNNGSMFTALGKFKDQSFWQEHPSVYITDGNGAHKYDIFAAYEVSTSGMTYALSFQTDNGKQKFINYCLEQSLIDTGLQPTVNDYILTLSTCTGHGHATRWVVQAVRKGLEPEAEPEQTPEPDLEPELSTDDEPENQTETETDTEPGSETDNGLTEILPTAY